jgi:predicted transcriptional regulator
VRTISSRLEAKGYLTHSLEGRTNVYRVIESRHQAAARAVRQIIDRYCCGSVEQLLTGMVEDEVIDQAELQLLARRIAQSKSKPGGKS